MENLMKGIIAALLFFISGADASGTLVFVEGDRFNAKLQLTSKYVNDPDCKISCVCFFELSPEIVIMAKTTPDGRLFQAIGVPQRQREFSRKLPGFGESPEHSGVTVLETENDKPCSTDCWVRLRLDNWQGYILLHLDENGESNLPPSTRNVHINASDGEEAALIAFQKHREWLEMQRKDPAGDHKAVEE